VQTLKDQPAAMTGGILLRYRLSGNSHPGSPKTLARTWHKPKVVYQADRFIAERRLIFTGWYRSKVFARAHEAISDTRLDKGKGWGLFCSDWREGVVFSPLIYGGSRSSSVGGECGGGKTPP
jgi:hypothetical protein